MTHRKKLIEVALPLEAINVASAREKSIRHGHPSTLHLWWSRKPLATARAVIFASLVDDPGHHPDNEHPITAPPEFIEACMRLRKGANCEGVDKQGRSNDTPRMRLFDFIEDLVKWESTTDEQVIGKARELILLSTGGNPPPLLDPFAGGGSIPVEAQRLGLEAHASDLNPVAVMINKAMIEIPPRFANRPPVNPYDRQQIASGEGWKAAAGLAADVRYYGEWMRDKAWERIGHLYPRHNGETVIAWIWARMVKTPNPALNVYVPLVNKFELITKGQKNWVEPQIDPVTKEISFVVKSGNGTPPNGTVTRTGGRCLVTDVPIPFDYIRAEGAAGRLKARMMAIVTERAAGRKYYTPSADQEIIAHVATPENIPNTNLPEQALGFRTQAYGLVQHKDLFTPRQLTALTTFTDLLIEVREQIYTDIQNLEVTSDDIPFHDARQYAESISVYLACAVSKAANLWSSLASWMSDRGALRETFARQTLSMMWDYAEANPFSNSGGNYLMYVERIADVLDFWHGSKAGYALQKDAASYESEERYIISADPPYYDAIGYADLSDFFYIWLRRSLQTVYPDIFSTMLVPKSEELIATPYRFNGNKDKANRHFENGLFETFSTMRRIIVSDYPFSLYYAFKESSDDEIQDSRLISSTGWEKMLAGLVSSGFAIVATWPVRTESSGRIRNIGSNALASSIVLVCRPRPDDAPVTSRREFINMLRRELPDALKQMQSGNIAPVDLAQAAIGPGMAVYSRYNRVLEADGSPLTVRTALQIINQELDAYFSEQEGDVDADTRFAIAWFDQHGFDDGVFGQADVLARAKNTSVDGIVSAGIAVSGQGKVRLIRFDSSDPAFEPSGWNPQNDKRPTVWEGTHYLIERLNTHAETGAAMLLNQMSSDLAAEARELAYRLYSICERKGRAKLAGDYNALVISFPHIQERAAELRREQGESGTQMGLFDET